MAFLFSVYSVAHMLLVKRHRQITKTDLSITLWRTPSQQKISFWYSPIYPVLHLLRKRLGKVVPYLADGVLFSAVLHRMGIDIGAALC